MARHRIWLCLLIGIFVLGITTQAIAASEENQQVTCKFKDVSASDSNTVFINYVSQRGLLNGFPDGTYHPAEGLTRAQAAVIMTKAGGLSLGNSSNPFKDVDAGHWAVPYISAATEAGYISGFPDGTFHPDEKLTRAQAMAMMMRLCTVKTTDQLPVLEDMDSRHWAAGAMASALASGMTGTSADGKKAYPDAQLSRAGLARALAILLTKDPGLYKTPLYGKVQDINGSVTLVRKGTESVLVNEIVLTEGDTLRTGDDGSARVNYPDGSSTLMDANSEIYVKSSVGRSYIKKNGEPGTAVELLNVELKQGTLFGALATKHETENKIKEQAGRASSRMAALPSFKYLAASDQATPWYRTAQTKKVKIKVDMPWGVAAVRGTFVKVTVNQDGTCRVSCLTGDAEVSSSGNNIALGQGQSSSISGVGQAPGQPGALNPDDKAAFDQVQNWVLQTAINMDTNQEVQNSQAVLEMTIEIPDSTPPESTAQVVIDALESSGIEIDSNVVQQLQGQLEGLISAEDSDSTPASPGDGGRDGGNGGGTITSLTYSAAGTYGSNNAAAPTVVSGNVEILVTGITLQNMVINGNLVLGAGIGDGNVALNNVTVNGLTLVYGGGPNSVVLTNCDLFSVIIDRQNNLVRIVAQGSTVVDSLVLNSGAKLEESNLNGEGFSNVASGLNLPAGAQVILSGNFSSLEINSPGISIVLQGGSIGSIDVGSTAAGCNIALADGTSVASLEVNAAMTVSGGGAIESAVISDANVVLAQAPAMITVKGGYLVSVANQQMAIINGLVAGTSGLLSDVTVTAINDGIQVEQMITDAKGIFSLEVTPGCLYTLQFAKTGFVTRELVVTAEQTTTSVDLGTVQLERNNGAVEGLIIFADDQGPWTSGALNTMFQTYGQDYRIYGSSAMADAPLPADYIVWIINDQNQTFYNNYRLNEGRFAEFVNQGGTLLFGACDHGWAGGSLAEATLPGGVTVIESVDSQNNNVNPNHPIMSGVDMILYGSAASHDYLAGLPNNATTFCVNSQNQPTLVEYGYGDGQVFATCQPLEFYQNNGGLGNLYPIYLNMFDYFINSSTTTAYLTDPFFMLSSGNDTIQPVRAQDVYNYTASVPAGTCSITVTPTANQGGLITVNGASVVSGQSSEVISLESCDNVIKILVDEIGKIPRAYTITITYYQPGCTISGTITDSSTTDPVNNATVILYASDMATEITSTITDANGYYTFSGLGLGTYYVGASGTNYSTSEKYTVILSDGGQVIQNIVLDQIPAGITGTITGSSTTTR